MSSNSKLWVIAGQNDAGKVAVLLANPTASPIHYKLNGLNGIKYILQQVSDSSESLNVKEVNGNEIEIGSYTVQLITLP